MAIYQQLEKNAGHPWEPRRGGFDLLYIRADTEAELESFVQRAQNNFWKPWLVGKVANTQQPGGVLFKPCGIAEAWEDSPEHPHPGRFRQLCTG